ncbi:MAG TPA: hypothetical protein VNV38_02945 [Stellaceae bacterium]|nr:hypothetical protein [Stellaceae bacterium]
MLRVIAALIVAAATSASLFVAADLAGLLMIPRSDELGAEALGHIMLLWPPAFIVALVHAVALGLPAYLIARSLGLIRCWVSLPGGFVVGALPYAILALPWQAPPENLVTAHIVPPFTWQHYAAVTCGLGLLGAAGGLAAWFVWRWLERRPARPI